MVGFIGWRALDVNYNRRAVHRNAHSPVCVLKSADQDRTMSCMPGLQNQHPVGYRDRNSTADRTLDILQLFTEENPILSGIEIATSLGVARSTGYRYLQTLVGSGFVEDVRGGFRLGPRIFELARLTHVRADLSEISLPSMRTLGEQTGETVLLTRRSGNVVVCLERVEARRSIRLSYDRGHVFPINAGASAAVLLAWAPDADIDIALAAAPLQRFTPKTLTEPSLLKQRLAQIRDYGVAVSREDLDLDVVGVAAPVRDGTGTVRAAVSVAALASRLSVADTPDVVAQVRAAASEIGSRLTVAES